MSGVAINVAAVLLGSAMGLLLRKRLSDRFKEILITALGLGTLIAAVKDIVATPNVPVLVMSLLVGGALGTLLHLQSGLDKLGETMQKKVSSDQCGIGTAFVQSTVIFCVGAMTFYGSISAGLGNNDTLYLKSLLDGVMAMVLAAQLGVGVMFSAISVAVIQSPIALLAGVISPIMTESVKLELMGIGGALVLSVAFNILKITKIRTVDLVPAMFGALVMLLIK